jgi:hypothetical protein
LSGDFFPGIPYKDPEKFQIEKSIAAALNASNRGGKRSGKQQGNGFKPRGTGRGQGNRRNSGASNRGGKSGFNNAKGKWQKNRGGQTRGSKTGKRSVRSAEQKA